MTSPPETDREYAYFCVTGVDNPAEITELLGIEPDKSWCVGEKFEKGSRVLYRKHTLWRLDSGLTDQELMSSHIENLLDKLERHNDNLWLLRKKFQTQFVCVGFYYQSFSWEIDFEIQRRATQLGISFYFDTYSFGDYHDEMVELRDQVLK